MQAKVMSMADAFGRFVRDGDTIVIENLCRVPSNWKSTHITEWLRVLGPEPRNCLSILCATTWAAICLA